MKEFRRISFKILVYALLFFVGANQFAVFGQNTPDPNPAQQNSELPANNAPPTAQPADKDDEKKEAAAQNQLKLGKKPAKFFC